MQLVGLLVNKKGQRHSPTALPGDAPVGAIGNHVPQTRFTIGGIKSGLFNGIKCQVSQSFWGFVLGKNTLTLVHANEPLSGCSVNHWRFVPPAMGVTVGDGVRCEEAIRLPEGVQDAWNGFPNMLSTKEREI